MNTITAKSDFDQIFEDLEAPEYPATCDNCDAERTNASLDEHICGVEDYNARQRTRPKLYNSDQKQMYDDYKEKERQKYAPPTIETRGAELALVIRQATTDEPRTLFDQQGRLVANVVSGSLAAEIQKRFNSYDALVEALQAVRDAYNNGPNPAAVRSAMDAAIDYVDNALTLVKQERGEGGE